MSEERTWRAGLDDLRNRLTASAQPFVTALAHGTMQVELFAPRGRDTQQPHRQDELYIISRGHSLFVRGKEQVPVTTGDVLFVPAGMAHRFEAFSGDFEAWVIFWGNDGGEREQR